MNKLEVLISLTADGVFTFVADVLNTYLSEYKVVGCPAFSHSEQYRQAYKPSYRIILMMTSEIANRPLMQKPSAVCLFIGVPSVKVYYIARRQ